MGVLELLFLENNLALYILVFAAFTNLTSFTVWKFGVPLLPVLFAVSTIFLIAGSLKSKRDLRACCQNRSIYIINAFALIFLLAGLINSNLSNGLAGEIYPLITGVLIFNLILLSVHKKEHLEGVFLAVLLSGPVLVLQGVFQLARELSAGSFNYVRISGWWGDPNTFAFIQALVYLLSFQYTGDRQKTKRIIGYLAQLASAGSIILSLSRGGVLLLAVISLIHWREFLLRKVYIKGLILASILITVFLLANVFPAELLKNFPIRRFLPSGESIDGFSNGRITTAITGLLIYLKHPFVGAGFGNLLDCAESIGRLKLHTHNMFIEILAVSGPLPFAAYIYMLIHLWLRSGKQFLEEKITGRVMKSFIISLSLMGLFFHHLIYFKPVWIFFSFFPVYFRLKKSDPANEVNKSVTCQKLI